MKQDEAEKLARKFFVDNGIGFDGARLVKLVSFIREIENAAYERAASVKAIAALHPSDRASARHAIRSLIQPPAQKEKGE